MRVEFRDPDISQCPTRVEPYARDPNVSRGREYDVHSISVYDGVVSYLVIDDLDYPGWKPAWLFRVTDRSIPADWICNSLQDWPELLIGPSFVADSQDAYAKMVELDATQVARLRQRIAAPQT